MKYLFSGLILSNFIICSCLTQSTVASPLLSKSIFVSDSVLAFPGAEGFGKYTTGGRGGTVLIVTNLNDDGKGSLREALSVKYPRIIVFEVSGNIELKTTLEINHGNVTIAGQSAPGEGITLQNYPIKINSDNMIIRYIRSRMGDSEEVEDDAISAIRQKNLIIDHCSFSWGTDEVASFYDNENFTLQWCVISESLNLSVHQKGEHGYGGIWGGKGATFHHNLLAHHKSRLPRFNGARTQLQEQPEKEIVDFRNNVIYNWKSNNAYAGERGNYNIVNNYYKSGPATKKSVESRILNPWSPYGNFYVDGNYMEGFPEVTKNNRKGVHGDAPDSALVLNAIPVVEIKKQSATDAYRVVLEHAGASYKRDVIDSRVVEEALNGTARFGKEKDGIIDTQKDVAGWPKLKQAAAPKDTDRDGMPDEWERSQKLDSENSADNAYYTLSREFTNIEVYLNSLLKE